MSRRRFLQATTALGAAAAVGRLVHAQRAPALAPPPSATGRPIRIRMGGYGPEGTSFSQALKRIGDRLEARFPGEVEVQYLFNVMDIGYQSSDLPWLVDSGILTLAYYTMTEGIPPLELGSLPFLFTDAAAARAAMDGALGRAAAARIEADNNWTVVGFFENGFRHLSNNVRPVHLPQDVEGLRIRVLASQVRTFELLGAEPIPLPLPQVVAGLKAGTLDGQENPFANTVTYGLYEYQRYYTATYHSYLSRPIFAHRPSFQAWPAELRTEMRAAVADAVALQRELHDREEEAAAVTIREAGGEIVTLSAAEHRAFVDAVAPIYDEARVAYLPEQLALIGL